MQQNYPGKSKNRILLSIRSEGGKYRTYRIDDRKSFSNLYNLRYFGYKFRQTEYIHNNFNLKFTVRKITIKDFRHQKRGRLLEYFRRRSYNKDKVGLLYPHPSFPSEMAFPEKREKTVRRVKNFQMGK